MTAKLAERIVRNCRYDTAYTGNLPEYHRTSRRRDLLNEQETILMLEKLPYSKLVEKAVLEMIQGGVPIRQITHEAVVALCQLDTHD